MSLARSLALSFSIALLPFAVAVGHAHAGEPASAEAPKSSSRPAATLSPAYLDARRSSKRAAISTDGAASGGFGFAGCMTDPSKCTCQSEDRAQSSACGDVLGYFCRESTQRLLAASCMDLFGGAMVCKCASVQQINSHLKAEETAAKKKKKKKKK